MYLNGKQLKAIGAFADIGNPWEKFNAVYLSPKEKRIIATNGHILCVVSDVEGIDFEDTVGIPTEKVRLAASIAKKKLLEFSRDNGDKFIVIKGGPDEKVFFNRSMKELPDFSKVTAPYQNEEGVMPFIDPRYMKITEDLFKAFDEGMIFRLPPTMNNGLQVFSKNGNLQAVLMPRRIELANRYFGQPKEEEE